jgi:hypothetical protein
MPIRSFRATLDIFETDDAVKKLVVVNRTKPAPVQRLLETALGEQVPVEERDMEGADDDTVLLVHSGDIIASSPLQSVMESFLLINSDLYRTTSTGLEEYALPSVLSRLDEEVLELRGYPMAHKEKLLLIAVSRYIEGLALRVGRGRLDAAFQHISRLDDEYGTRRVYERLAKSAVDVHVYGVSGAEWVRRVGLNLTPHTGDTENYRRSWFVVFDPEDPTRRGAALVAWETDPNVWRSAWTFDGDRVDRVQRVVFDAF